eukprot:668581-Prymnesium_polylepis.1
MCAGGYFVDMLSLPEGLRWIRFTSFWYYTLGLWARFAIPDPADRVSNSTITTTLQGYSFSPWSWDGHPGWDVS